jgi:hypothetical protein
MRLRVGLASLTILLLGAAGPNDLPVPSAFDLSFYSTYQLPDRDEPLHSWEAALKQALTHLAPNAAADSLAGRFGLTQPQAREFVRLWLFVETDTDNKGNAPALRAQLTRRYQALVAATHRMPLVLGGAAIGLAQDGKCDPADFDALTAGAPGQVEAAWLVARSGDCPAWYGRFVALAPDRALPALSRLAESGTLPGPEQRALDAWLVSDAALARVAPADRVAFAARRRQAYVAHLLDVGLVDRALAFTDALPAAERAAIFAKGQPALHPTGDGLGFTLASTNRHDNVDEQYIAALALAGRRDEAGKALAALPDRAATLADFTCSWNFDPADPSAKCKGDALRDHPEIVMLDHFLNHDGEDPYPLAETMLSSNFMGSGSGGNGVFGALDCRIFTDPGYAQFCGPPADFELMSYGDKAGEAANRRASLAAITAAAIPGFAESRASLTLPDTPASPPKAPATSFRERPAVEPETPHFAKLKLPAETRGTGTAIPWSKAFAPLPDGFAPVRIGRDGARVAVISVSQNLDPTGEVSAGGYWVHLSGDGGKSWQPPLYTGLAEAFPYVVLPKGALPVFDGDTLTIAVDVALIDTRSITYPPVGLRTLQREHDLYIRVPIADLRRDSDGDGITDLVEHHLLLDKAPGAQTPFIVGSDAARCSGPPSRDSAAMVALLAKLFQVRSQAIIEPMDRAQGAPLMEGWRGAAIGADRPILLSGDPAQFACLRPDRLMIVYSPADLEQIGHFTPDFHAIEFPRIVYNRAHDRGFVQWSTGWAGGTYRLKLVRGEWQFDSISSWIT